MQFNSILFPGPALEVATPMQNIVYIPRNQLREPPKPEFEEEEKKDINQEEEKAFS